MPQWCLQQLPEWLHSVLRLLADCFRGWEQVMRRPQFAAAGGTSFNGSLLAPGADTAHTGVQQG